MLKKEDYEDLATAPLFEALLAFDREGTEIDYDALIERRKATNLRPAVVPMVTDELLAARIKRELRS